jgi:hypothetical protein
MFINLGLSTKTLNLKSSHLKNNPSKENVFLTEDNLQNSQRLITSSFRRYDNNTNSYDEEQTLNLKGGRIDFLRGSQKNILTKTEPDIGKICMIQRNIKKFLTKKKINKKNIIKIQSFWRMCLLRSKLYFIIKRYYIGRAFIGHLVKFLMMSKKKNFGNFITRLKSYHLNDQKDDSVSLCNYFFEKEKIKILDRAQDFTILNTKIKPILDINNYDFEIQAKINFKNEINLKPIHKMKGGLKKTEMELPRELYIEIISDNCFELLSGKEPSTYKKNKMKNKKKITDSASQYYQNVPTLNFNFNIIKEIKPSNPLLDKKLLDEFVVHKHELEIKNEHINNKPSSLVITNNQLELKYDPLLKIKSFSLNNQLQSYNYEISKQIKLIENNIKENKYSTVNNYLTIINKKIKNLRVQSNNDDFSINKDLLSWNKKTQIQNSSKFNLLQNKTFRLDKVNQDMFSIKFTPKPENLIYKNENIFFSYKPKPTSIEIMNQFTLFNIKKPENLISNEIDFTYSKCKNFLLKKLDKMNSRQIVNGNNIPNLKFYFNKWHDKSKLIRSIRNISKLKTRFFLKHLNVFVSKRSLSYLKNKFSLWRDLSIDIHKNILATVFVNKFISVLKKFNKNFVFPCLIEQLINKKKYKIRQEKLIALQNKLSLYDHFKLVGALNRWKYHVELSSKCNLNLINDKKKFHLSFAISKKKIIEENKNLLNYFKNWRITIFRHQINKLTEIKNNLTHLRDNNFTIESIPRTENNDFVKSYKLLKQILKIDNNYLQSNFCKWRVADQIEKEKNLHEIVKEKLLNFKFSKFALLNPSNYLSFYYKIWKNNSANIKQQEQLVLNENKYIKAIGILKIKEASTIQNYFNKWVTNVNNRGKILNSLSYKEGFKNYSNHNHLKSTKPLRTSKIKIKGEKNFKDFFFLQKFFSLWNKNILGYSLNEKLTKFEETIKAKYLEKEIYLVEKPKEDEFPTQNLKYLHHDKSYMLKKIIEIKLNQVLNKLKLYWTKLKNLCLKLTLNKNANTIILKYRQYLKNKTKKQNELIKLNTTKNITEEKTKTVFITDNIEYRNSENNEITQHNNPSSNPNRSYNFRYKSNNILNQSTEYFEDNHANLTVNTHKSHLSIQEEEDELKIASAMLIQNAWRNYLTRRYLLCYSHWLKILKSLHTIKTKKNKCFLALAIVKWKKNCSVDEMVKASDLLKSKLQYNLNFEKNKRTNNSLKIIKNMFTDYIYIMVQKNLRNFNEKMKIVKGFKILQKIMKKTLFDNVINNSILTSRDSPKSNKLLLMKIKNLAAIIIQNSVRRYLLKLKFNPILIKRSLLKKLKDKLRKILNYMVDSNQSHSLKETLKKWYRTWKLLQRKDHAFIKMIKPIVSKIKAEALVSIKSQSFN